MKVATLTLASITTGFVLVGDFGLISREIEKFMGYPVWTHQLPRASDEIAAHVQRQIPNFPGRDALSDEPQPDEIKAFMSKVTADWGDEVEISPILNPSPMRDPLEELETMVGRDRVIPVIV